MKHWSLIAYRMLIKIILAPQWFPLYFFTTSICFPLPSGVLFPASLFQLVSSVSVFWTHHILRIPTDLHVMRVRNIFSWWFGLIQWGNFSLPPTIQSVQQLSISWSSQRKSLAKKTMWEANTRKIFFISNIIKAWNLHSRNSRRTSENLWYVTL